MSVQSPAWFDELPVPWQRHCLDAAIEILPAMPGVRAAWVGGSLARNEGDEFSDIDLNCLVSEDSLPFWRSHWSDVVARCVGSLMLARTINDSIIGGFAVTSDWKHVDLIVHAMTSFARPADCRPLYDPSGLIERAAPNPPDVAMDIGDMSEFFLYLAGSFATVVGRGELILAQNSVITLRQWLVRLMLAENDNQPTGGARRMNRYLSAEQRNELEEIGMALGSLDDATAAAATVFRRFVHRAERLARERSIPFPDQVRVSAEQHLERTLGARWPSGRD